MSDLLFDKEALLNKELRLSRGIILYRFIDKAFLGDETDNYGFTELDDVECDVVSAINRLHDMRDVWASIKNEYNVNDDDVEAEAVFFSYVNQLINAGLISDGRTTIPEFGEAGKAYPLYVSAELTNQCNFKCQHCYKEAEGRNNTFIDADRLLRFLHKIEDRIHSFTFTGGEATLHPDFSKLILALPDKKVALLTNGSRLRLLSDEVLSRIGTIQVSLYGCSKEEYQSSACSAEFDAVIQGLQRVAKINRDPSVAIILRPSNLDRLSEYVELVSSCGIKHIKFGSTLNTGRNLYGAWSLSPAECERAGKRIDEVRSLYPDMVFDKFDWREDLDIEPLPVKDEYRIVCSAGKRSITISEKGFVRPCNYMPSDCFEDIPMETYLDYIDAGKVLSFDGGVAKCLAKFRALGKNIDCICPKGFE